MTWVLVESGAVIREFSRPTVFTHKDFNILETGYKRKSLKKSLRLVW